MVFDLECLWTYGDQYLLGLVVSLPFFADILYGGGKILLPCSKRFVFPSLVLGVFGSVLPLVWDVTNILEEHQRWCKEGMPATPSYRVAFMMTYGLLVLVTTGFLLVKEPREGVRSSEL